MISFLTRNLKMYSLSNLTVITTNRKLQYAVEKLTKS